MIFLLQSKELKEKSTHLLLAYDLQILSKSIDHK
jgi:hypothetical protein